MIHGIVVVVRCVGTSRAVWGIRTVGRTRLIRIGWTLLIAIIVICIVVMTVRTTVLLSSVVWTAKDLIRQSDVLHAWRVVWRLRIWGESLAFVRREGIRGPMLR